jgi:hypothetical protein
MVTHRYQILKTVMMMMMVIIIIIIRIIIIFTLNHSIHLLISLHTPVPRPSQSQSTLYSHQSTHLPTPFRSFLLLAGWWLSCCYRCFLPRWESQNVRVSRIKCQIFTTWKKPRYLGSRNDFCGTKGHSCLKPINPGWFSDGCIKISTQVATSHVLRFCT